MYSPCVHTHWYPCTYSHSFLFLFLVRAYKALRSAASARHAGSQGNNICCCRTKQCEWSVQRSRIRCKLTTCKCQELHAPGKQPGRRMHASYKYVPGTKQKEECCIVLRLELIKGKSFAHHPLLVAVYFLWRGRFDFFVGFENTASYR